MQKKFLCRFAAGKSVVEAAIACGIPESSAYEEGIKILRHPEAFKFVTEIAVTMKRYDRDSIEECLDRIAESINMTLESTAGVTAVNESTAGQGSNLGHEFEQIAHIIDKIEDKTRVGVCVDTCHTYSAGYDLRSEEGYKETWKQFDEIIGGSYLRALHLNDDKRELGSRIDRHESIGEGTLGRDFFRRLVNDPRFDNMPLILETPDEAIWPEEIKWLYSQIEH